MPGAQSRPPWADSKASGAWLEQRYPLGDASLGSPLYRYIRDVYYKPKSNNPGTSLLRLDGGTNSEPTDTDDQPTAHLRDHDAALDVGNEMQKRDNDGSIPSKPEPQGEHHVHVGEDRRDKAVDSERLRSQMTSNVIQSNGDRTEQTATSVAIPVQIPQRNPEGNQELLPDGDAMHVPVIQNKHKRGRKPSTKAPPSEPQREQGKRKPPTKDRKNWASKQQREQ